MYRSTGTCTGVQSQLNDLCQKAFNFLPSKNFVVQDVVIDQLVHYTNTANVRRWFDSGARHLCGPGGVGYQKIPGSNPGRVSHDPLAQR